MRYAGSFVMSCPAKVMVPDVAVTSPVTVRATVDLPDPFEPTSATIPPAGTVKETLKRAR